MLHKVKKPQGILAMKTCRSQNGVVMVVMVFIIALMMMAYLFSIMSPERLRIQHDQKTIETLSRAKQAMIAWSVNHYSHPGQMPFPDRNADGNYDGNSDCNSPSSAFSYAFLLGQLPVIGQTNPCTSPQLGLGEDFRDAEGNRLWYAVSRNLTHIYELATVTTLRDPVINPDIVNYPALNPDSNNYPAIQSAPLYQYPWLKVLDANGNVLSDRVAVVIIAPGDPVGGQTRTGSTPNPDQYLDSFVKGGVTYNNASYTVANQAFVMGLDGRDVSASDPRFSHPYYFNDKLTYITIDELMTALNNRAASEVSRLLNRYKAKTGQFPYAAPLDARLTNHLSSIGSQQGLVPIDGTDVCSCESQLKCTCSFNPISKVTFTRGSGTWSSRSGACTRFLADCNCTGAGSCQNTSGEYFSCTSAGVCDHNVPGSNSFTYTVPDYANISKLIVSGCADPVSKTITCNDVGQFAIGLDVPSWFRDNLWQDFFFYRWSNYLEIGSRIGMTAILVGTGPVLNSTEMGNAQTRPSSYLSDYLDSAENSDGGYQFDPFTKRKTTNYNDQPFIVAP